MNNPYDAPETRPAPSMSWRKISIAVIFGVVAIGAAIGYQTYRFNVLREAMKAAEMRALQAERQAIMARQQAEVAREQAEVARRPAEMKKQAATSP